jgi:hypothetical protein
LGIGEGEDDMVVDQDVGIILGMPPLDVVLPCSREEKVETTYIG